MNVLELPWVGYLDAKLADDSDARGDVHQTTIVWDGRDIAVAVLAMGQRPLLGTALLAGCNLNADFVDNGPVSVQRL